MLKSIFRDFLDDDCPTMAAALAYYAVFSLPAVLFLLLALIGLIMDPRSVQERILSQFGDMVGGSSAQQLEVMVRSARSKTAGAGVGVAMSIAALIFGGTGAFMQL
ncbi:MAG TPA: YhjD/YihY/BrkB family envelope integrity protein, partial [Longimicrobiales bacterium]|nr:YhjD/YihY/BrkB family envelope integrity protein [Longimicrobiales bacterium]